MALDPLECSRAVMEAGDSILNLVVPLEVANQVY